jgi:hypothetical protein
MPITPPEPRYTVEDTGDGLRVIIPSKMSGTAVYMESLMLLGLIVMPFFVLRSGPFPLSFSGIGLFNVIYALVWLYLLACTVLMLLWTFMGVEVLKINHHDLTVRQQLLGLSHTRKYANDLVYHLRVAPIAYRRGTRQSVWEMLGLVSGPVAFEYSSKTVRFGAGLKEVEARMLVDMINQRFPQYGRSWQ